MKTDNKIDLSKWNRVIELESIAEKFREDEGFTDNVNIPFISGFTKGANWQKEKDKLAVNNFDKLVEALKQANALLKAEKFTAIPTMIDELLTSIEQQ